MTIGNRLEQVRKYFCLDQRLLSKILHIKPFELNLMENSLKDITDMEINALENLLGVSPEWLIFGTGKMLKEWDPYLLRNELQRIISCDTEIKSNYVKNVMTEINTMLDQTIEIYR